ncbi:MAG: DNA-directed RNA polymerase subunit K [Candidatus Woesearchaeota archaeon]
MAKAKKKTEIKETFSRYEKARMIGSRALQIAMGAPFLVKLTDKELKKLAFNPIEIAKTEFKKGVIPITVKRPLPSARE